MKDFFSRGPRYLLPLCILVALATHFLALGWMPFFGADEPRYSRVGQEMLLRADLVTPTLNFKPWLEKPPLLFWMEAISFRLLGASEASARLPAALAASLCAIACGLFLAGRAQRRAGLLAFLILSTTPLYIGYARAASTDMPLVASYALAMLATYLALEQSSLPWTLAAGAALGLALLAKGPVALILFAGSWMLFGLFEVPLVWSTIRLAAVALIGLVVAFPWYWLVWKANGFDFLATFFINHHLARFLTTIHRHPQPFWFFLAIILLGFFPWSIFLFANLQRNYRSFRAGRFHFQKSLEPFLWSWVLVPLVFFSISSSKLAGYILPVFPALAMLVALEWERLLDGDIHGRKAIRMQSALVAAIAVILAIALVLGAELYYHRIVWGLGLAIPVAAAGLGLHHFWRRRNLHTALLCLILGFTVFAALAYSWVAPQAANFHSTKALVELVKDRLSARQPLILYRFFHHTALYYSDYHCLDEPLRDEEELLLYLSEHPQEEYLILVKLGGLSDLAEILRLDEVIQRGNVYLVKFRP